MDWLCVISGKKPLLFSQPHNFLYRNRIYTISDTLGAKIEQTKSVLYSE